MCRVSATVELLLVGHASSHRLLQSAPILDEVLTVCGDLIRDQYGNYVIQHVLSAGRAGDVSAIVNTLSGNMLALSQHKFASNVVERCLEYCSLPVMRLCHISRVVLAARAYCSRFCCMGWLVPSIHVCAG